MTKQAIHICHLAAPPDDDCECWEMIWSQGRACRKCPRDDCYRQGWLVREVRDDNRRLVEAKRWRYRLPPLEECDFA